MLPHKRLEDLHDAVTFLSSHEMVDPEKIALWGLCFDGNMALAATAQEYVPCPTAIFNRILLADKDVLQPACPRCHFCGTCYQSAWIP